MSTRTRTGLLAVGIVAVAFLCVGGSVGGLIWAKRDRGTEASTARGHQKADDEPPILAHKWWKSPPSKTRLDEIVKHITEKNRNVAVVLIDRQGKLGEASLYQNGAGWIDAKPEGFPDKCLAIKCDWAARPSREDVLAAIRTQLDVAEYRDGKGR